MPAIILAFIYSIGAAYIANSRLGDLLAFQAVYRVIYVPLAFWAFTFIYASFFSRAMRRKVGIQQILALGIPSHISLLLANVYFSIALQSPVISSLYKIYIEAVLYITASLLIVYGIRISRVDRFFAPFILVGLYPVYLSIQHGQMRPAVILMLILPAYASRIWAKIRDFFGSKWRAILIIFLFAALVRMVFGIGVIQKTQSRFILASDDGETYDRHGWNIAKDISYLRNRDFAPSVYDTGYSLFLGLVYKIFGRSFYIVVVIQSLIGASVPVMVYLLGVRIDKTSAILAAFWASLDQPLIMLSSILCQEALYIPFLTCIIFLVTNYSVENKGKVKVLYDILIGALLGAANAVRTAALYFVPVISAYLLVVKGSKRFFKKAVDVILILSIMFTIIAPITYLNFLNSGRIYLLTEPKPLTDWMHDAGQRGDFFPTNKPLAEMGINPFQDPLGSLVNMAKDPLKFLSIEADLLPRRIVGFFFCCTYGFFDPIYMVNASRVPNRFASNLEFYTALAIIIGFFLIMADKNRRKNVYPALLLISYYTLIHVVIFRMGTVRYRAPIHPYLIIFGAVGIRAAIGYVRKGLEKLT